MNTKLIKSKFKELYSDIPLLVRSPGRINLIGEHTDYNDGFVFPAAIDKEVCFAVAENDLGKFRFYAFDLAESFELDIDKLAKTENLWANYLVGVAAQFKNAGYQLKGIDCVFGGNIPMGAGLSSSAAIENGFAFALNEIFSFKVIKMDMVKMAQKAEHEYAGVMCGIMDQFASMKGKKDHALKLDCRSLDFEYANIDLTNYVIVLCDTKVKHELASSEYNTRRQECEAGVKILQKYNEKITALRDVEISFLQKHKAEFETNVYKRCAYVVNENMRVQKAFKFLKSGYMKEFGAQWFDVAGLPKLLFDHNEIFEKSLEQLRFKASYQIVGLDLLPERFTITQLRLLYNSIFQREFDPGNFRKKILSLNVLKRLDKKDSSESKKGAFYYEFMNPEKMSINERIVKT